MKRVEVRKPFRFLPPIAWALGIDALDIVPNVITGAASLLGFSIPATLAADLGFDVIQIGISVLVFETPFMWLDADPLLPPGLDLFPSNTAELIYYENFMK